VFHSQSFRILCSLAHFGLQSSLAVRRVGWQEQPAFAGLTLNSEDRTHGIFQTTEVIEVRILAESIAKQIETRTGMQQYYAIVKCGGSSLPTLGKVRLPGRSVSEDNGNDEQ